MSADRELLELAAKAAGIKFHSYVDSELFGRGINIGDVDVPLWNPLDDDGDALRLAVKLDLLNENPTFLWNLASEMTPGSDPLQATRRAVVLTAAAIGRTV